jgi:hypothetical protein
VLSSDACMSRDGSNLPVLSARVPHRDDVPARSLVKRADEIAGDLATFFGALCIPDELE